MRAEQLTPLAEQYGEMPITLKALDKMATTDNQRQIIDLCCRQVLKHPTAEAFNNAIEIMTMITAGVRAGLWSSELNNELVKDAIDNGLL